MTIPLDSSLNFVAAYTKWAEQLFPFGLTPRQNSTLQSLAFLHELKDWNQKVSLVADSSDEEWVLSHFLDSLMPLKMSPLQDESAPARAIDVGTGGGFPGVILAFSRPQWSMTLLDSVQKKTTVLENILNKSPFPPSRIHPIASRAETLAKEPEHREAYNWAFCRAVGPLSSVLEFTLPFVKVGGACFLHRGVEIEQDVMSAERALQLLGGKVGDRLAYQLPHRDKAHHILQIRKISSTPTDYPRRPGVPEKKPL